LGKDVVEQMAKNKQKAEMRAELEKAEAAAVEILAAEEVLPAEQSEPHDMPRIRSIARGQQQPQSYGQAFISKRTKYEIVPRSRPDEMRGTTYKTKTPTVTCTLRQRRRARAI